MVSVGGVVEIIVRKDGKTVVYNGVGGFGAKDIGYPAEWGDRADLREAAFRLRRAPRRVTG